MRAQFPSVAEALGASGAEPGSAPPAQSRCLGVWHRLSPQVRAIRMPLGAARNGAVGPAAGDREHTGPVRLQGSRLAEPADVCTGVIVIQE